MPGDGASPRFCWCATVVAAIGATALTCTCFFLHRLVEKSVHPQPTQVTIVNQTGSPVVRVLIRFWLSEEQVEHTLRDINDAEVRNFRVSEWPFPEAFVYIEYETAKGLKASETIDVGLGAFGDHLICILTSDGVHVEFGRECSTSAEY